MDDKSFRVLLDFTEINAENTLLKYVWLFVSPRELKTIFDLKKKIIKNFNLPQESFNLFVRDGLLVENEKIGILREEDTVKLQYQEDPSSVELSFISCNQTISVHQSESLSQNLNHSKRSKKRKISDVFYSVVNESSPSPKQPKKKKSLDKALKKNVSYSEVTDEKLITSNFDSSELSDRTYEVNSCANNEKSSPNQLGEKIGDQHTEKKFGSNDRQMEWPITKEDEISAVSPEKEENSCKKKKRKRKRVRKDKSKIESSLVEPFETNVSQSISDKPASEILEDFRGRKHIIYHSPSPPPILTETVTLDSNGNTSTNENVDCSSLTFIKDQTVSLLDSCVQKYMKEVNLEENFESKCDSVFTKTEASLRNSTPLSRKMLKEQSWSVTPLQKVKENGQNSNVAEHPFVNCTPLTTLPPIGTHIAYKTLELSENYCPEVTEYKEGIIKNIDPKTDDIEIELVQEEIKPGRIGKFENLGKDEDPQPQIIKTISTNWTSLIEPRLISPT